MRRTPRPSVKSISLAAAAATPAITRRAEAMADRLQTAHQIGLESLESGLSVDRFAKLLRLNVYYVSKCRVFARHYSPSALRRLCALRRSDGLALNFAHVNVLTIVPRLDRLRMEKLIAAEGWTAPRAHQEVKRLYRAGKTHGGGRPIKIPADPREHLQGAVADAALFFRRHHGLVESLKTTRCRPSKVSKLQARKVLDALNKLTVRLNRQLAVT